MQPTDTLLVLTYNSYGESLMIARTGRPIAISFFYAPWTAAAASSDYYMSSHVIASALHLPTAFAFAIIGPVCMG